MEDSKIALIDLDATIADYDKSMTAHMMAIRAPGEPPYVGRFDDDVEQPYMMARRKLIQRQDGFWLDLKRHPIGFQVVDRLREIGYDLHVLTKGPAGTPSAWTEKAKWCSKHIPDAKITITQDKSLSYGRVLVDDYPPYYLSWLKRRPRGLVVAVAHPWNKDETHPNVLRFDGSNTDELYSALKKAYDR